MTADAISTVPGSGQRVAGIRILCVCTGNIARSPVLAGLLDIATDASVDVSSAGTRAVTGSPVDPSMVRLLGAAGVRLKPFAARDLSEALVIGADLVLCLDSSHRRQVVDLVPSAMRRTFVVRELARLVHGVCDPAEAIGDDAARIRSGVAAVSLLRGSLGSPEQDDIADPFGRTSLAYQAAFEDIVTAVDTIRRAVALSGDSVVFSGRHP